MAEGRKTFVNDTDKPLVITLFIRAGDSPADAGGTEVVNVGPHNSQIMIFEGVAGSAGYVFLNGLLIEWPEGPDLVGVARRVVVRGDAWDATLNTNERITISQLAAGTLDAVGSN